MLVISQNSNPHAILAVFIEGWTICKPANHASNEKKTKFYEIVKAWKMFPAVPYIWVCKVCKVFLLEYLQNYAVLLNLHWSGLSAQWTD